MVINMLHTLYVLTIMDTTVVSGWRGGGGTSLQKTAEAGRRTPLSIHSPWPMTVCVCVWMNYVRGARRRPAHHEGSQSADRAVLDILCVERDMIGRGVETEVRGRGGGA